MEERKMIEQLQDAAQQGRLTIYMYQQWLNDHTGHSVVDLLERYGSWTNVLRVAGLEQSVPRFTKKEMVLTLRRAAKEYDAMNSADYRKWAAIHDGPTLTDVVTQFGSWKVALIEAELIGMISSDQKCEIIQALLDASAVLSPFTSTAYAKWAKANQRPSITKVVRRFGSWTQALEEIGIVTRQSFSELEMLQAINEAGEELPTLSPWQYEVWQKGKGNRPALREIQQMFGTFEIAVAETRLEFQEEARHHGR